MQVPCGLLWAGQGASQGRSPEGRLRALEHLQKPCRTQSRIMQVLITVVSFTKFKAVAVGSRRVNCACFGLHRALFCVLTQSRLSFLASFLSYPSSTHPSRACSGHFRSIAGQAAAVLQANGWPSGRPHPMATARCARAQRPAADPKLGVIQWESTVEGRPNLRSRHITARISALLHTSPSRLHATSTYKFGPTKTCRGRAEHRRKEKRHRGSRMRLLFRASLPDLALSIVLVPSGARWQCWRDAPLKMDSASIDCRAAPFVSCARSRGFTIVPSTATWTRRRSPRRAGGPACDNAHPAPPGRRTWRGPAH